MPLRVLGALDAPFGGVEQQRVGLGEQGFQVGRALQVAGRGMAAAGQRVREHGHARRLRPLGGRAVHAADQAEQIIRKP